jgi:ketosteroid isomerase-like protein
MIKSSLITVALCAATVCIAQNSIDGMIQTEKKFADTAMLVSTKKAFLSFADNAGIVFDKGNAANAVNLYTKSERRPGILNWQPEYAEISSSNDFGYTTGPWSFYDNSLKDKPVANGHFVTVWHLTKDGEWKFLIDFGISYKDQMKAQPIKTVITEKLTLPDAEQSMNLAEEKFIEAYKRSGRKACAQFLSANSRLNYSNHAPATDTKTRTELLNLLPLNIAYTNIGSGMSISDDLGYMYGTAVINGKQDGYLRIWRKEKTGWKIALEVLHF